MSRKARIGWFRLAPLALTMLRLLLAPLVVCLAYAWPFGPAFVACLGVGLFSDVFDGILARRLGVATHALRRLDSAADIVFYLAVLWSAAVLYPAVLWAYAPGFGAVLALEAACQWVSFARSGRSPATHAYSAKCWVLFLFAASVALLGFGQSRGFMEAMIAVGCVADLEAIAILLVAPPPAVDIPSIFHAWRLRRNRDLKQGSLLCGPRPVDRGPLPVVQRRCG
jgi:CDP-diacylglycerol--glycerol-3-phosphate 3-phosphatidyltransferase